MSWRRSNLVALAAGGLFVLRHRAEPRELSPDDGGTETRHGAGDQGNHGTGDDARAAIAMTVRYLLAAVVLVNLAGCTPPTRLVERQDDMLVRAGFQQRPANSPTRLGFLKSLPPNTFVTRTVNGQPIYLYADPVVCNCLYRGSQQAWDAYQRERSEKGLAAEQAETREAYQRLLYDENDWGFGVTP
jgi:hypothetical protein